MSAHSHEHAHHVQPCPASSPPPPALPGPTFIFSSSFSHSTRLSSCAGRGHPNGRDMLPQRARRAPTCNEAPTTSTRVSGPSRRHSRCHRMPPPSTRLIPRHPAAPHPTLTCTSCWYSASCCVQPKLLVRSFVPGGVRLYWSCRARAGGRGGAGDTEELLAKPHGLSGCVVCRGLEGPGWGGAGRGQEMCGGTGWGRAAWAVVVCCEPGAARTLKNSDCRARGMLLLISSFSSVGMWYTACSRGCSRQARWVPRHTTAPCVLRWAVQLCAAALSCVPGPRGLETR